MLISTKTLTLYFDYAKAYNQEPDSQESNKTFDLLSENIFNNFDEDLGDEILDTLCTTKNKLITAEDNLYMLDEIY